MWTRRDCGAGTCAEGGLRVEEPFPDLRFTRPVDFQIPGDGSGRIFVLEQAGIIKVFDNRSDTGSADTFLDITDRVRDQGNEEGLLGLAFHPEFATNRYFFVDYTASDPRRTVVARYDVDPSNSDRALSESETVILEVAQPYGNHNGGQIVFGPDGYLYVTLGDGGSGGDPQDNGEDPSTLLGSILRIDVDGGSPYAIPPDNPFAGNDEGYREEIYAYGLRNPWRISFDPPTGQLWAADVGQNLYEEVHIIEAGENYGWDVMEGLHCYEPDTGCDREGLILPVWEYSHDLGISITGGFVYRGDVGSLAGGPVCVRRLRNGAHLGACMGRRRCKGGGDHEHQPCYLGLLGSMNSRSCTHWLSTAGYTGSRSNLPINKLYPPACCPTSRACVLLQGMYP